MKAFPLLLAAALAFPSPALPWVGRVVSVQTGDTLTVTQGARRVRVRLAGIEAPARRAAGWRDSRASLVELCRYRRARIAATGGGEARVLCRGPFRYYADAARYQVDQGQAWLRTGLADPVLEAAFASAQAQCVGLWTGCTTAPGQGAGSGSGGGGTGTITYAVRGTAATAGITVETPEGSEQHTVTLPWSRSYSFAEGDFVYLSAQNQGEAGSVTVSISLDGVPVKSATATAGFGIASVSCTRGRDC